MLRFVHNKMGIIPKDTLDSAGVQMCGDKKRAKDGQIPERFKSLVCYLCTNEIESLQVSEAA